MNLKELKEIINLMHEHNLSELEIEKQGIKIKLKRVNGNVVVQEANAPALGSQTSFSKAEVPSPAIPSPSESAASANETLIRSPMVGTFYAASGPDQPSYVNVGSVIKMDDVLCIVDSKQWLIEFYRGSILNQNFSDSVSIRISRFCQ